MNNNDRDHREFNVVSFTKSVVRTFSTFVEYILSPLFLSRETTFSDKIQKQIYTFSIQKIESQIYIKRI